MHRSGSCMDRKIASSSSTSVGYSSSSFLLTQLGDSWQSLWGKFSESPRVSYCATHLPLEQLQARTTAGAHMAQVTLLPGVGHKCRRIASANNDCRAVLGSLDASVEQGV